MQWRVGKKRRIKVEEKEVYEEECWKGDLGGRKKRKDGLKDQREGEMEKDELKETKIKHTKSDTQKFWIDYEGTQYTSW